MQRVAAATKSEELPPGSIIRRSGPNAELITRNWGLRPAEPGGKPIRLIRSEGRRFRTSRCLVPATDFMVRRDGRRFRFSRADGNFFYFAGIWRPQYHDWPESYAILTIRSNPDIEPYQGWMMAPIELGRHIDWLLRDAFEADILVPPPARTFVVERLEEGGKSQPSLLL